MRRILISFVFLGLFVGSSFAQDLLSNKVPIIIPIKEKQDKSKRIKSPKIELRTDCIVESTRVKLDIYYAFKEPLNDTLIVNGGSIELASAELIRLYYTNSSGDYVGLSIYDKQRSVSDQCIWNLCVNAVNHWIKHQPYDKFDYQRFSYLFTDRPFLKLGWQFVIYLVPNL